MKRDPDDLRHIGCLLCGLSSILMLLLAYLVYHWLSRGHR